MKHPTTQPLGRIITIFTLLLAIPAAAAAHPHIFISTALEFVIKEGKIQGVYETWTFDRFFSADIIQGYDVNGDGSFNAAETKDVYDNAFINTQHYAYFTFIRQGEKRSSPQKVSNFSVGQKTGVVFYRFYVDLSHYSGDFYFAVYDYTFFCHFRYAEPIPITFIGDASTKKPSYTIAENKKYPVYYDPFDSAEVTPMYDKWKPGLQTYYPREIHITY